MASLIFGCFLAMLALPVGASSGFLDRSATHTLTAEQKSAVLAAIEKALGENHRQATEVRLVPLVNALAPTLTALPKNRHGKFGHMAVRYALHRLFVQRHAWFVKGIDLNGDFGDDASHTTPTDMLQDGVPDEVQTLFEERLGSEGLGAHEVAVMAATFENLAHAESMERLRLAYEVKRLAQGDKNLTAEIADSILEIYMAAYIMGLDLSQMIKEGQGESSVVTKVEVYPGFNDVREFVHRVRKESTSDRSTISFADLSHVVTRIGDEYGRWQHYECDDLKRKLFAIEDDGTGRVPLAKFYDAAINLGHWQFAETPDYLRSMGALDESIPSTPRVIVSNYILSPSNCVASSNYYSVCCLDECEELVGQLEREISAPAAKPERIASLVATMPSSTTPPNQTIPTRLRERLYEIATANDGLVPLHGRMFAQWMHHAYPRECPYPHMSGTFKAMRLKDYAKLTGLESTMSEEEMQEYVASSVTSDEVSEITWSHQDELYVEQAPLHYASGWAIVRFVVFFIPAFSTVFFVLRLSRTEAEANRQVGSKSHYV
jgi:hypothetical protein